MKKLTIEEFKKFVNDFGIGFSQRVKVNVNNVGRVPFINVGPQTGVSIQCFQIEGLIAMGYSVEIAEDNEPTVAELVAKPVVEVVSEPVPELASEPVAESDTGLILEMDHGWLKTNLSISELKSILDAIDVKFNNKALEDELVKLVLKNQDKVKENFKVA
jgi:hypothetical protein